MTLIANWMRVFVIYPQKQLNYEGIV